MARLALIAEEVGNATLQTYAVNSLKNSLSPWFKVGSPGFLSFKNRRVEHPLP